MSKFKIEHSAGQNFLVVQGQKGQQISDREFYAINNGMIPGLLKADLIRKGSTFKLSYNISGFISLKEFLLNPLNKQSFAKLLGNILNNLKALQKAYYNHQFILMDMDAAMVNPATQQVNFVYVPITFYDSGTNLKEFLLSIIQCCSFVPGENTDYVKDYIRILNNGINFSVFDLEEYIKRLNGGEYSSNTTKKCTRCGAVLQPNVNFCAVCGFKIAGLSANKPQAVYNPAKVLKEQQAASQIASVQPPTPPVPPVQPPVPINNLGQQNPQYLETISTSQPIANESVRQPVPSVQAPQMAAQIIRLNTGERIRITSDSFKIGKDPFNSEYCIRDNTAVSRIHALIKRVNNRWFITDMNSTNSTYINDRKLYPNVEVELFDGTNIRLANENFIFNLIR